jgi:hypothetical protein
MTLKREPQQAVDSRRNLMILWASTWAAVLLMCYRQADLCEKRAGSQPGKCGVEWQLAISTAMGLSQTIVSLMVPVDGDRQRINSTNAIGPRKRQEQPIEATTEKS